MNHRIFLMMLLLFLPIHKMLISLLNPLSVTFLGAARHFFFSFFFWRGGLLRQGQKIQVPFKRNVQSEESRLEVSYLHLRNITSGKKNTSPVRALELRQRNKAYK